MAAKHDNGVGLRGRGPLSCSRVSMLAKSVIEVEP